MPEKGKVEELGVLLDIVKWVQIASNRCEVPGYPGTAY
jgi:hypothetical protein